MKLKSAKPNINDKELVQGCLESNRIVQKALFDQFNVQLYTIAYRLLNNHELANDVLQDAFIEIFGSLNNFSFRSTLYTWMRTIVIRNAISKVKGNNKLQIVTDIIPERQVMDNLDFTVEHLETAIQSLPEGTRAVFILIEVEGYKHREVAKILNISIGTSKSQLNYAKKLLRQKLTPISHEARF